MTDIKQKALALVNEVRLELKMPPFGPELCGETFTALCRAIESHEAFKQEVSREMEEYSKWCKSVGWPMSALLERFIIPAPKPDPLAQVLEDIGWGSDEEEVNNLRAGLEARGFEIREKNGA